LKAEALPCGSREYGTRDQHIAELRPLDVQRLGEVHWQFAVGDDSEVFLVVNAEPTRAPLRVPSRSLSDPLRSMPSRGPAAWYGPHHRDCDDPRVLDARAQSS
jgi:hypothetical protein